MGVDIGGTGIKGAPVDVNEGQARGRALPRPHPESGDTEGRVGRRGRGRRPLRLDGSGRRDISRRGQERRDLTAANVNQQWVGTDAEAVFSERLGSPTTVLNDADAAGLAEVRFGAGRDRKGTVVMITLGTGIGCGMFHDGVLVPNIELGHIEIDGKDAETLAADSVRERKGLSWKEYAHRVEQYIRQLDALVWPDLVIIGGGASKKADKCSPHVDVRPEVVPAALLNEAGIVGAAVAAAERKRMTDVVLTTGANSASDSPP